MLAELWKVGIASSQSLKILRVNETADNIELTEGIHYLESKTSHTFEPSDRCGNLANTSFTDSKSQVWSQSSVFISIRHGAITYK